MKEVNISINSFIEKLKEVDVVELLEKAQSIKIEDIKKIKFADFKKSDYFYPTIGITASFILTLVLLIPSINQTRLIRNKSKLYVSENRNYSLLEKTLIKKLNLEKKLKDKVLSLDKLVAKKNQLLDFPLLLEQISQESSLFIDELRPISKKEAESICSLRNSDKKNIRNISQKNNTNINDFISINQSVQDSYTAIDPRSFKINKNKLNSLFTKSSNDIGKKFRSNYFYVESQGTFSESLKFLNKLQDYRMTILPTCFLTNIKNRSNLIQDEGVFIRNIFVFNYPTI